MKELSVTIFSFQFYPSSLAIDLWMNPRGEILGFQEY